MDYYNDDYQSDNESINDEINQPIINDINYFYLDIHNVILLDSDDNKVYEQSDLPIEIQLAYRVLRSEYSINQELENYLLLRPHLIITLTQQLSKKSNLLKEIYNSVINHTSTDEKENKETHDDMVSYLLALKKSNISLYNRIISILTDADECCVCFSGINDIVFQCGHKTCSECNPRLNSCPICRQYISKRTSAKDIQMSNEKVEIVEKKEEKEKKEKKEKKEREQKEIIKKKPILKLVNKQQFLENRIRTILNQSARLRPIDIQELEILCNENSNSLVSIFRDLFSSNKIKSEEIICYVAKLLYNEELLSDEELETILVNPNRLVRFFAGLHSNKTENDVKLVKFKELKKSKRKLIIRLLNKMNIENALIMMKKDIEWWKRLFKSIHAHEYLSKPENSVAAIIINYIQENKVIIDGKSTYKDALLSIVKKEPTKEDILVSKEVQLRNLKLDESGMLEIKTLDGELNEAFKQKDKTKAIEVITRKSGLLFRNLRRFIYEFGSSLTQPEINILFNTIKQMTTNQLVELKHILEKLQMYQRDALLKPDVLTSPVYLTSTGKLKVEKRDHKDIDDAKLTLFQNELLKNIEKKLDESKDPDVTGIIIEEESILQLINKGIYSDVPEWAKNRSLSRGDLIKIDRSKDLIAYIHWQNGKSRQRIDLDLSFVGYDANFTKVTETTYYDTAGFNGLVIHSGDITNAPQPASEYVKFNIEKIVERFPTIKYLVVVSMSYTDIPFEEMREALVGLGTLSSDGTGPGNSDTIGVCKLKGGATVNIGLSIEIDSNTVAFMNINANNKTNNNNNNIRRLRNARGENDKLSYTLRNFYSWRKYYAQPSHLQLSQYLGVYNVISIIKQDGILLFIRGLNESYNDFYGRIINGQFDKKLKDIKEVESMYGAKKIIYVGSNPQFKLKNKSYLLNKWKPSSQTDVNHITDAFSLFDLLSMSKSSDTPNLTDPLSVKLGLGGNIRRGDQIFKIIEVDMNGDCLFNSILQQQNTNEESIELRKRIANELKTKSNTNPQFKQELLGHIALWQTDIGDVLVEFDSLSEDEKISKYLEFISTSPVGKKTEYSNKLYWGGQLEITTIVERLRTVRINIITYNSNYIIRIPDDNSTKSDIYIYYNGAHYNIAKKIN